MLKCFECEGGEYVTVPLLYPVQIAEGKSLLIKDVPHEICRLCGDMVFGHDASEMIDDAREANGVVFRKRLRR